MYFLLGVQLSPALRTPIGVLAIAACCLLGCPAVQAQDQASEPETYAAAIKLLPDSVAGLVRIPNVPRFCDAWTKTHLGRLMEEESMKPFVDAQRARAKNYLESIGNKVGIKLEDIYEIASGEAVAAWLPFAKDSRRPYAICVVADVRGNKAKAEKALETIDSDLKGGGWMRRELTHRGQEVRVYKTKPKPGQLKVEEIAITLSDERVIAADRDSVVTDLLDAIAGEPKGKSIAEVADFKDVLSRSGAAVREPVKNGGGTIAAEWFAKPFEMGRILRESLEVDRGNQVDILKLLEGQGFDVIRAAGGILAIAGEKYDLLHRGFVSARQSELENAAEMLQFENKTVDEIPAWIDPKVASFNRLNLGIEAAFWASETLVNGAVGDEIFRDIIDGIRDDEDGPQIDIAKNVLPNLDDQVILITDTVLPADANSDRMLVAIRVRDANKIRDAIRKAMEVEPDAKRIDAIEGVEIWEVETGEGEDDFDTDLFGELELGFEEEEAEQVAPLLEHWAIAMVDKGPGSSVPYLMFSSHPDLLIHTVKRIQKENGDGLATLTDVKHVMESIAELGGDVSTFDRVVRTKLSLRAKYQLLREGKLKDSDSVLAALYRRIAENTDGGQPDPLNAAKLPPITEIEEFLPNGGSYIETTDEGWSITGFLLK